MSKIVFGGVKDQAAQTQLSTCLECGRKYKPHKETDPLCPHCYNSPEEQARRLRVALNSTYDRLLAGDPEYEDMYDGPDY